MNQENKPQEIDLDQGSANIAKAVNAEIVSGIPIPFIIATLTLILHNLSSVHIARTEAVRKLAKMGGIDEFGGIIVEDGGFKN